MVAVFDELNGGIADIPTRALETLAFEMTLASRLKHNFCIIIMKLNLILALQP